MDFLHVLRLEFLKHRLTIFDRSLWYVNVIVCLKTKLNSTVLIHRPTSVVNSKLDQIMIMNSERITLYAWWRKSTAVHKRTTARLCISKVQDTICITPKLHGMQCIFYVVPQQRAACGSYVWLFAALMLRPFQSYLIHLEKLD